MCLAIVWIWGVTALYLAVPGSRSVNIFSGLVYPMYLWFLKHTAQRKSLVSILTLCFSQPVHYVVCNVFLPRQRPDAAGPDLTNIDKIIVSD